MITYLVKGNVALSIALTAISSLVTVFTIPLVINLAMQNFMGEAAALQFSFVETTLKANRNYDNSRGIRHDVKPLYA